MKLEEAKKYLNNCGFILEDTETLDDEIEDLERQNREHPELREAHKALAREIITDLHGKESYEMFIK